MTKAESQANLAYPEDIIDASPLAAYPNWIDRNLPFREGFVKGYEQAEKDIMECAVETVVSLEAGANPVIEIGVGRFGLKVKDKVKVIIVKED